MIVQGDVVMVLTSDLSTTLAEVIFRVKNKKKKKKKEKIGEDYLSTK